jgi:hypothetical protein
MKEKRMELENFIVNPITLVLIILGVVEMVKKLGVTGNKLMLISMAVGFFLALLYKTRELYEPSSMFIDVAFFGIAAGLGASGVYSFVTDRFPPQTQYPVTKAIQRRDGSITPPIDPEGK